MGAGWLRFMHPHPRKKPPRPEGAGGLARFWSGFKRWRCG